MREEGHREMGKGEKERWRRAQKARVGVGNAALSYRTGPISVVSERERGGLESRLWQPSAI